MMEQKKIKRDYEKLFSYISELQQKISEKDPEAFRKINVLAAELGKMQKQEKVLDLDMMEPSRAKDILEYIYAQYDGTEESVRRISKKLQNPEKKYEEVTAHIKILGYRKSAIPSKENKEEANKLFQLALYLLEVRKQRHLPMAAENDRIERIRFKEILEYIDKYYDGTDESTRNICNMIENRQDIDEVLKYHKREDKEEGER